MKPQIVLDTNILVSALLVAQSFPGKIIKMVGSGELHTRYTDKILAEYIEVLVRKKFNFSSQKILNVINGIIRAGIAVQPIESVFVMPDESDRKFYETAKSTNSILINIPRRKHASSGVCWFYKEIYFTVGACPRFTTDTSLRCTNLTAPRGGVLNPTFE